jgi:hypothetical protein
VIRRFLGRSLKGLLSLRASAVVCCLAGLLLLGAPIALWAPIRASESNNTLPAEEETKSGPSTGVTSNQARRRYRVFAKQLPVLTETSIHTSSRARTSAPYGQSEHALREGLGTPLRC